MPGHRVAMDRGPRAQPALTQAKSFRNNNSVRVTSPTSNMEVRAQDNPIPVGSTAARAPPRKGHRATGLPVFRGPSGMSGPYAPRQWPVDSLRHAWDQRSPGRERRLPVAVTLKPPNRPLRAGLSRANTTARTPDRALRLRPWLGEGFLGS